MAGRENIGGFYYSLGIDTDKGSFARAAGSINGLVNIAKAAAAAIGAGFAVKATVAEAINDLNWANKLGIGTYELDKWQAATAQIKINFNSIAGEMDSLDKKFRGIKFGDFDSATATAIEQFYHAAGGQWNESAFETLRNLSPTARFEKLMELAETAVSNGMEDNDVRLLLGKILGGTSGEMFNTMRARKLTMADLFNSAEGAVVDTSEWKDGLAEFNRQLVLTKTTLDRLWTEPLGRMEEKWLNPALKAINGWLGEIVHILNGQTAELNSEFYKTYGVGPDTAARAAADLFEWPGSAQARIDSLKLVLPKDMVADIIAEYNRLVESARTKEDYMKEMGGLKGSWAWLWEGMWSGHAKKVKDGIISPNGGITQVDSNDWVLAFKNIGDVAGAFHQGGQAGGVANVTITQTFNVNGNPMPGAVREQAYRGTSSAMSEAFTRAGMVIQMMPGTR